MTKAKFSTFCHIDQYGAAGYDSIPRMLAMSRPLNLWAPTGVRFSEPTSRISAKEFVQYVEDGYIRILGREPWLLDPAFRKPDRWPESQWVKEFDGVIKKICEEDESKPTRDRRVLACPPETGWLWADEYLEANPHEVARWSRLSKLQRGNSKIPVQIRERAQSYGSDAFLAARQILRDAHNHGRAYADSGAEVPFILSATDVKYLSAIAASPNAVTFQGMIRQKATQERLEANLVDVTSQLVDLLRILDIHSPKYRDSRGFARFVRGEGHDMLVSWIAGVCSILRETDPRSVDGLVLGLLRDSLGRADITGPIKELIHRKDEGAVGIVGMVSMVAGLMTDPVGVASIAGILAQVYPLGKGLSRQLGFAPSDFPGEQWPFLYTYGKPASRRSLERIRTLLDQVRTSH